MYIYWFSSDSVTTMTTMPNTTVEPLGQHIANDIDKDTHGITLRKFIRHLHRLPVQSGQTEASTSGPSTSRTLRSSSSTAAVDTVLFAPDCIKKIKSARSEVMELLKTQLHSCLGRNLCSYTCWNKERWTTSEENKRSWPVCSRIQVLPLLQETNAS